LGGLQNFSQMAVHRILEFHGHFETYIAAVGPLMARKRGRDRLLKQVLALHAVVFERELFTIEQLQTGRYDVAVVFFPFLLLNLLQAASMPWAGR
ncbi:MAG: hypothetical protein WAU91_17650, partial [Desulfatitalea sp.]